MLRVYGSSVLTVIDETSRTGVAHFEPSNPKHRP